MKKIINEVIQFLIDNYKYQVMELRLGNSVPNAWCVNKSDVDSIDYMVFTNSSTHYYFQEYRGEILNKTFNSNLTTNIYEVFIDSDASSIGTISGNIIIIDFEKAKILVNGEVPANIIGELKSVIAYKTQTTALKKNFFEDNKGTVTLIVLNIAAFIFTVFMNIKLGGGLFYIDISVLYKLGAIVNISNIGGEIYRFVTNMFLHSGITHLFFNMYALFSIGPVVERVYGKKKFYIIYFLAGTIAAFLTSFTIKGIAVGASGAIFGLLGATLIFAYRAKKHIGKGLLFNILSVIVVNIVIGLSIPNISNAAHMCGLLSGMIISNFMYVWRYKKK